MAEDAALRALGEAQRVFQSAVARKQAFSRELENALIRRERLGEQPIGAQAFLLENDFISGTKQRIIQSEQAIFRASKGVEKALRNYLHARRQTRAIEVLREKHFAEFKKELAKQEQKRVEDLYVMRAMQRTGLGDQSEESA